MNLMNVFRHAVLNVCMCMIIYSYLQNERLRLSSYTGSVLVCCVDVCMHTCLPNPRNYQK